jgi:hypothetical protein
MTSFLKLHEDNKIPVPNSKFQIPNSKFQIPNSNLTSVVAGVCFYHKGSQRVFTKAHKGINQLNKYLVRFCRNNQSPADKLPAIGLIISTVFNLHGF